MTLIIFLIIITLLMIAFAEPLGERIGVVAPIILLLVGVSASYLPQVPEIFIEPEVILQLILPPLLFATAMRMPQHDFRRNFSAIFVLAVILVAVTSMCVGLTIHLLVPEIPLAIAVAVGAVVSPSDAVAVGIVRRAGVNRRIIAVLDGEGLINDASALVLLSSALLAARSSVSAPEVAGRFLWAVTGAVVIGYVVGKVLMALRGAVHQATSSTVVSLVIPFAAFLPAEAVGASGLVATVVAGLVVSHMSVSVLAPATRISDGRTWDTVGLILESLVFLLMGLQMPHLVDDAVTSGFTIGFAAGVALVVWVVVLLVRALTVAPLLWYLHRYTPRRLRRAQQGDGVLDSRSRNPEARANMRALRRMELNRAKTGRALADSAYYSGKPLGARAGAIIVWAGMRGAVTLAAAQTLPQETPARGFLILVAFVVAAVSLVVQGGTLSWVVNKIQPGADEPSSPEELRRIRTLLRDAALTVPVPTELSAQLEGAGVARDEISHISILDLVRAARTLASDDTVAAKDVRAYAVERVDAQREVLVGERGGGRIDAEDFERQLRLLDAQQLAIQAMSQEYRRRQI